MTMAYSDTQQIGEVTEVTGVAKVIRTDGSVEPVMLGTEIYEGDIVETEGAGAVNIGFIDDSSFAVSENARVAIDEFVFDPSSEAGAQDFSVLRGVFMYTSGLIGRENPDSVEIDTPVGSIGIRGTIIGGKINPDGESQVTVIEGAIVVRNDAGERMLSTQYDTVRLSSMTSEPSNVETLDVSRVANDYGSVKDVSAQLFSAFNDQMKDQGPSNNLDESSTNTEGEADGEAKASDEGDAAQDNVDAPADGDTKIELKTIDEDKKESKDDGEGKQSASDRGEKLAALKGDNAENRADHDFIKRAEEKDDRPTAPKEDGIDTATITFQSGGDVLENSGPSTPVGTVGPTANHGITLEYSLVDDAGGKYTINPTTGEISIATNAGDWETLPSIIDQIKVQATNTATGKSRVFDLEVNITDVNEVSEITSHTANALDELDTGLTADTVVATLDFAEADIRSAYKTRFETNDSRFEVRSVGGVLQLVALGGSVIDHESEPTITVSILQSDGENTYANYDVTIDVNNIIDEIPTDITLSTQNFNETINVGNLVATLTATDADGAADSFTYTIVGGNDHNIFTINGDRLEIADKSLIDYESGVTSYDLDIQVMDSAGATYTKTVTLAVNDIDEAASLKLALADVFDVTGGIKALLSLETNGAVIGEIKIGNLDAGDSFVAGDFSVTGSNADLFEVVGNETDGFHLKLKDGYTVIDDGGNYRIHDGSGFVGGLLGSAGGSFTLNVEINDDGKTTSLPVEFGFHGVGNATSGVNYNLGSFHKVVYGSEGNDIFTVSNDDFKLIRGGDGYDQVRLDGTSNGTLPDVFDLSKTVSNLLGNSADLSGIEEIIVSTQQNDVKNTLIMNVEDILKLLKTSSNGELRITASDISNINDKANVQFKLDGSQASLDGLDMDNDGHVDFASAGTVSHGGHTYYVFEHDLGNVLLDANLANGSSGGA